MTYDQSANRADFNDWTNWARTPGFHPGKVLAVIAGLAIFPPLGVAAAVYFVWNSRRARFANQDGGAFARGGCGMRRRSTGNEAFDAHRAKIIEELEAERAAFAAFRADERMKKDQAEFDNFRKSADAKSND